MEHFLDDQDYKLEEADGLDDFEDLGEDELADDIDAMKLKREAEDDDVAQDIDDTVFIDNLPKEETQIRVMLKEVNKHIRDLERKFFEEEDSELEEANKIDVMDVSIPFEEHCRIIEDLKSRSHITQFFSIPLSDNVKNLDFDDLA